MGQEYNNNVENAEKMNILLCRIFTAIEESKEEIFEIVDTLQRECARLNDKCKGINEKRNACEKENAREYKDIETLLRNTKSTLERAERLTTKFSVALEFLEGNKEDFSNIITDIEQRQMLGRKIIQVQEEERRRVSREIHDGPAQTLSNILLKIDLCEKLIDIDPERAKKETTSLKQIVRTSTKEIRKIIYNLRPVVMDDVGLEPTLKRYVEDFEENAGIQIEFKVTNDLVLEDAIKRLALFRVVQEALHNVLKHANATKCCITLQQDEHQIMLKIEDNGTGFDVKSVRMHKDSGFGIMNMRERIELLNGNLHIVSGDGQGTKLTAVLPLQHREGYHE